MPILTAEWVLPISSEPIHNGYVLFGDNLSEHHAYGIQSVGRIKNLNGSGVNASGLLDGLTSQEQSALLSPPPGSLITPGLINTHIHLEQSWPEPVKREDTETFLDWLLKVVAINHASSDSESKRIRCEAGVRELLRTGTTCVNDIASGSESLQALGNAGLRGLVSMECFYPGLPASDEMSLVRLEGIQDAYKAFCADRVRGTHRLRCGLSPHSPYNVSIEAWQWLLQELSPELVHSHVGEWLHAESCYLAGEGGEVTRLHQSILGKMFAPSEKAATPVSALKRAGLLNHNVILAHCIETNQYDREALQKAGVRVAHCPRSNMRLHGQTLHWDDWKTPAIPIALGTDGRLSTPDLDLRAEARFAHDVHGWDAGFALDMMTRQGARVMNLPGHTGTIEPSSFADLVLWQAESQVHSLPPEAQVLAPSTSAQSVFIDGICRWQANVPAECR